MRINGIMPKVKGLSGYINKNKNIKIFSGVNNVSSRACLLGICMMPLFTACKDSNLTLSNDNVAYYSIWHDKNVKENNSFTINGYNLNAYDIDTLEKLINEKLGNLEWQFDSNGDLLPKDKYAQKVTYYKNTGNGIYTRSIQGVLYDNDKIKIDKDANGFIVCYPTEK